MDLIIKVADFGLSVNTGNKDYYRITSDMGIKLPFKWMAPESLTDYIFSEMSDVVSICELEHDTTYSETIIFIVCSGPMESHAGRCSLEVKSLMLP